MFVKVFTAVALVGTVLAQTFSIQTPPSLQQCQVAGLSWTGGTAPYILAAIPAGQVSAPVLTTIAENVSGNSYAWTVNLAQGTSLNLRITDSLGNIAYSSDRTVQAGSSGCLSASASGSGSAAPSVSGSSSAASLSSVASSLSSAAAATTSASRSGSMASSMSSMSSMSMTASASGSGATTPAASASSSRAAADSKATFNVPFLALAAAIGCVAFGGFATLA